jgi:hypothetical protein
MFPSIILVSSALIASSHAALCTQAGLPASLKAGDSFTINPQSNGQNDGSITSEGISGTFTIVDSCSFNITMDFDYNAESIEDPKFRWYGTPASGDIPFPIADKFLAGDITQEAGARVKGSFSTADNTNFALTRQGAFIGGVDYSQFITITLFSETTQWLVASVNLPVTGAPVSPNGSGNPVTVPPITTTPVDPSSTSSAVSLVGASSLVAAVIAALL